jgi:lysophospholipase L1-like esterase
MTPPGPDQASGNQKKLNWFERNPKKTLGAILTIFFLMCVIGAEKLLSGSIPPGDGYRRFINLREHKPLYSGYIYPTDEDLYNAELLERKKYLLRVDKNGYIMPSQIHPEADLNLVFLGGSTTECLYMDEKERFPYLVGRLIENELHLKVNSYNSGKAGNNSLHSIDILLNKVMYINPDIVIMMHNINDLIILLFEKSYWNDNKYKSPIIEVEPTIGNNLGQSFVILRDSLVPNISRAIGGIYDQFFAKERKTEFPAIRGQKIEIRKSQLLQDFAANLQIFIDICQHRRIIPVLITMANRFSEDPDPFIASKMQRLEIEHDISYKEFKEIFDLFNEQIRTVGKANNVLVIDLANKIPQEKIYLYDTVHLTPLGSNLVSRQIFQELRSLVTNVAHKHNNKNS